MPQKPTEGLSRHSKETCTNCLFEVKITFIIMIVVVSTCSTTTTATTQRDYRSERSTAFLSEKLASMLFLLLAGGKTFLNRKNVGKL